MANRYFESKAHAALYQQFRSKPPQQLIDRVITYLKEKYENDLKLAVDVGCGSGQSTLFYADHFEKVVGLDVSPNQIEVARKCNDKKNVEFDVSPAEKLPFEDGTVQLVTAMAAVHWFDLPTFFEEVRRVLSPGGVLTVYNRALGHMRLTWEKDERKNEGINRIYGECIDLKGPLTDFAPPSRSLASRHYRDITIPYQDFVRDEDSFFNEGRLTLADIIGEIQTLSAYQPFKEAKGEIEAQAFLNKVQSDILDVIGEDLTEEEKGSPENIWFLKKTPFVLLMSRK